MHATKTQPDSSMLDNDARNDVPFYADWKNKRKKLPFYNSE